MAAIDPEFYKNLPETGEHEGHKIYGETNPPEKLGIHGYIAAVDFDICIADGVCIDVCPTAVFEWLDTPGTNPHAIHPDLPPLIAERKADPIRENDCIFCMACEIQCPVQAIKIVQP